MYHLIDEADYFTRDAAGRMGAKPIPSLPCPEDLTDDELFALPMPTLNMLLNGAIYGYRDDEALRIGHIMRRRRSAERQPGLDRQPGNIRATAHFGYMFFRDGKKILSLEPPR